MDDPLVRELVEACTFPIALVGVGNPLRGDDGFGPAVLAAAPAHPAILPFEAGMAPENWLGPIARAGPATVLVLDATDLGEPPGTLRLLRPGELESVGVSTHGLPLGFFLQMVAERCSAPVLLLAVQPQNVAFDAPLSEPMRQAIHRAAAAIAALGRHAPPRPPEQG
ncbi:MAG: hydrogenase maturation protease [Candidatus Brocadiia bacterium]